MVGSSLHHYRILHPLGAGGMGQVYAAEDTKLHRKVAVKILPADVADDPERLQRFQREAQAVASLNHPNVVTIHSVEEDAGVHFLTMELVEGRTLADLTARDGMPIVDLLRIAVPLVDAVAAAHQCGIVHRDLKPANVMVGADGRVKVLDFGLAKLKPEVAASAALADMTTTPAVTLTGDQRVLGTTAYMSPEQAEGRAVDQRTDIFALGVVLYELATGVRPFQGETTLSVISSILKDSPRPICERNPELPVELDRIVQRCLAKDPANRYQDAIDLRHDLEDLQHRPTTARFARRLRRAARLTLAGVVAALLVAVAVYAVYLVRNRVARSSAGSVRASFAQLTGQPGAELFPSLSPDGRWVVYSGEWDGNRDIYLQSASPGSNPVNLTRDSSFDDEEPAFSPDGEHIVFRSNRSGGGLWVMGRTGESVTRLTSAGFNPAWSPDGARIAFTSGDMQLKPQNSDTASDLYVVDAKGGEPRLLHKRAVLPSWSPDGKRIAFTLRIAANGNVDIWSVAADGGEPVPATSDPAIDWNPVWAPDGRYLYFASDRGGSMNLWRLPIDAGSGKPLGEPEPIMTPAPFAAHLSLSADGRRIAYSSVVMMQNVHKVTFDPVGGTVASEPISVTTGSRAWSSPDPSPDGQWVAFYSQSPEGHMHVIRSDGTQIRQLTGDTFIDRVPRWSPDGQWIAWFSNRARTLQIWKMRADGSDLRQVTEGPGAGYFAWSPDGARMAASALAKGERGVTIFDPNRPWKDQQPKALSFPPNARGLRVTAWSPDGAQLAGILAPAYGIGTYTFANGSLRECTDYGEWPTWLPDSRRILFVSEGKSLFLLDTKTGAVRKIYSAGRDIIGPPRLTRDGRTMFFTRRVNEGDVWLASLQ